MNKCQYCGTEKCYPEYRHAIGMNLCMRCIDKLLSLINDRNVDEFWKDEYAIKEGLEKFVIPSAYEITYFKKRVELMGPVKRLDYNFRKGYDL